MSYRAYKLTDAGWEQAGSHPTRVAAKKAAGKRGCVIFMAGARQFLSMTQPYTMPADQVRGVEQFEEITDLTI